MLNIKFTKDQTNAPFTLKINNGTKECACHLNTTLRSTKDAAIQTIVTEINKTLMCATPECAQFRKVIQILKVIEGIRLMMVRDIGTKEDHAVVIEVQYPKINKPELFNKGVTIISLRETIENTCTTSKNPSAK